MIDMDLGKRFLRLLECGCINCNPSGDPDEIDHCELCCKRITEMAFELVVIRMDWPELYDQRRAFTSQRSEKP